jgi:ABC-type oligopeptide transport system substrate-binding subunit
VVSSKTDTAAVLEERFAGKSSFYVSMLYPPDYVEAIQKAISAPNFELKRKYTQEAMKLMIDKYCLQIPIYCPTDPIVTQPYVHSHGAGASAANALWTPEEAWKER